MKKLIFTLIALFILIAPVHAEDVVFSSGLTTTDRLIATGNCYYYGMNIISGASTAVIVIYDAITISGTTVDKGQCTTSQAACSRPLPWGVEVFDGIYADTTGTGAAYTVFYRCK